MKTLVVLLIISLAVAVHCQGEQAAGNPDPQTAAPALTGGQKPSTAEQPQQPGSAAASSTKVKAEPTNVSVKSETATPKSSAVAVSTSLIILISSLGVAVLA